MNLKEKILEEMFKNGKPFYNEEDIKKAMEEYAKVKCEVQRILFHNTLTNLVRFDNNNEQTDFVIDIMQQTGKPNFE